MSQGLIIALVIIGIVVLLLIIIVGWFVSTLNGFRRMEVKIDESESGIDVALTKRFDLLTKMVATVKGYAKHEAETLTSVIAMRQPASNASIAEKQEFATLQTEAIKNLNVVVEKYPELKANENFIGLQKSISEVEDHLQASRRLYNSNVSVFNQKVVSFPASIIAGMNGIVKREFFEAEESKRQDVNIEF